jgi:uncharacterized protein (DUF2267 family)
MPREARSEGLESTVRTSREWVSEYAAKLGQSHPATAFRCLRVALHAIRDRLPIEAAASLATELPMLLRGAFYEDWRPGSSPDTPRTADELYQEVLRELESDTTTPPHDVMRAAFSLLEDRVDWDEIAKVRRILPQPIRAMWATAE